MTHILLVVIYISFISLGLPDTLLGSAWPVIHLQLGVEVSAAGLITSMISVCTVISSLFSNRVIFKLGNGRVTALSTAVTAVALFGFSTSNSLAAMFLWTIPYGLGAGCIDTSLNNYVAVNYASRHMSWLHCMWAIGAAAGPYIMGYVLTNGMTWNTGYRTVGMVQLVLTIILFLAVPLWKITETKATDSGETSKTVQNTRPLKFKEIVAIKGVKSIMITFFCFCTVEQTALVWAASYFAVGHGLSAEKAALFGAACITGEMLGRFLNGFLTCKFSDVQLIRLGQGLIVAGVVIMLLPFGAASAAVGIFVAGFGIAPIYPCLMHSTPQNFGLEQSQAVMGVQTASAFLGAGIAPPILGFIAQHTTMLMLPVFMLAGTFVMWRTHENVVRFNAVK